MIQAELTKKATDFTQDPEEEQGSNTLWLFCAKQEVSTPHPNPYIILRCKQISASPDINKNNKITIMTHFSVDQKQNKQFHLWLIIIFVAFVLNNYPFPRSTPITGYNGYYVLMDLFSSSVIQHVALLVFAIAWLWMLYQLQKHSKAISHTLSNLWLTMGGIYVLRILSTQITNIIPYSFSYQLRLIIPLFGFSYIALQIWIGCILTIRHSGRLRQLGIALLICSFVFDLLFSFIAILFLNKIRDPLLPIDILRWLQVLLNAYILICMRRVFMIEENKDNIIAETALPQ